MDLPDHYRILQVDPSAEQEVIEAAYRRLARKYHPDVYKGNDATERMKRLNMAFAVLGNANSRREFDYLRERQTSEATSWETRQTYSETPTYPQPETNAYQAWQYQPTPIPLRIGQRVYADTGWTGTIRELFPKHARIDWDWYGITDVSLAQCSFENGVVVILTENGQRVYTDISTGE